MIKWRTISQGSTSSFYMYFCVIDIAHPQEDLTSYLQAAIGRERPVRRGLQLTYWWCGTLAREECLCYLILHSLAASMLKCYLWWKDYIKINICNFSKAWLKPWWKGESTWGFFLPKKQGKNNVHRKKI